MSILSTAALSFSMSADAFAVSLGKGACIQKPRLRDALRTGAIFGIVESITPVLGWCAGVAASRLIEAYDHWVAFAILGFVGGKLIWEAFHPEPEDCDMPRKGGLAMLLLTALGTSIDSLAVGVTLAFLPINIWLTAACIGGATTLMATLGIMIGHHVGNRFGALAEIFGGVTLIAIGTHILFTHLGII